MSKTKLTGACSAAFAVLVAFAASPAAARDMSRHGGEAMVEKICAAPAAPSTDDFGDRIAKRLNLSDAQKAALKDVREVHAKARVDARTAMCTPKPDLSTFGGRLAFHEKVLEAHLSTVKATRPKLDAFYNSLDEKQKKGFLREGTRLGQ
jgi:hypothetical protein